MSVKSLCAALICAFSMTAASAEVVEPGTVSSDYLVGRWSLEGRDSCGAQNAENVEFMANEVFHLDRGHQVDAVGFWEMKDNRIDLHLVTSPHRISGALPEYSGMFDYVDLAVFVFEAQKDSFEAIVPYRNEVRKRIVYRCQ